MATLTSFRFILLYPRQWFSSGRGLRWVHYVLTATSSSEWFCDFSRYICGLLSLVCYVLASSNSTPSRETKIGTRKWTYQGRLVVSMPVALHCTSVPSGSTCVLDPWQAVQAGKSYRFWHSTFVPSHWVLSSSSNFVPPTTRQLLSITETKKRLRTCCWTVLSLSRLYSNASNFRCWDLELADLATTLYCSLISFNFISSSTT